MDAETELKKLRAVCADVLLSVVDCLPSGVSLKKMSALLPDWPNELTEDQPKCGKRSYLGKVCVLDPHPGDEVHQNERGLRWRGDADAPRSGSLTMDGIVAAFRACHEARPESPDRDRAWDIFMDMMYSVSGVTPAMNDDVSQEVYEDRVAVLAKIEGSGTEEKYARRMLMNAWAIEFDAPDSERK